MHSKHAPLISLIVPALNEAGNLQWHYEGVKQYVTSRQLSYEIIYIDDGSTDDTLNIIKKICKHDPCAHFISLSRNFGKEAGLTAGLRVAKGRTAVCIDADGQYPLETVDNFLEAWRAGAEVVIGVRNKNASEAFLQRLGSRCFYTVLKLLDSEQAVVSKSTDFRLLDRRVIDVYNELTEHNRIARNLIDWLGFRREYVTFDALGRHSGTPTYSLRKRLKLAGDGIIKHSTKPLKMIGIAGVAISFISAVAALFIAIETYILGDPLNLAVTGTGILALLLSFLIGVVLVCQGLLALYLENVYHETQNRPLFIIREQSL